MFPDHGAGMSFVARGHKADMVFAPLESPHSDKVVAMWMVGTRIAWQVAHLAAKVPELAMQST